MDTRLRSAQAPPDASPSRRTVLAGAGLATAALTATACGAAGPSPATVATSVRADGAVVLATADQVPVGGAVVAGAVAVTQPVAGTFLAFSTTCPHRGCAVMAIGDTLDCPCHRSVFSLEGRHTAGPAHGDLTPVPIEVQGTEIVRA